MFGKYSGRRLLKALVVFILSILLTFALYDMGLRAENILLIFVVGILIIIVESASFIWGILSAIIFILMFNFFFTEPRFSLNVDDPNHYVSFIIFFIVAAIVATLMSRLQKQMNLARHNAAVSENLYEMSKGFWHFNDEAGIVAYAERAIFNLLKRECKLFILDRGHYSEQLPQEVIWCFKNSFPCGCGETKFSRDKYKYLPIRSANSTLGVVQIDCSKLELSKDDSRYLTTVLFQLTIALERYRLNLLEEESRTKLDRESLRNNLLRSISHDLRTPLTGIAGGSGLLLENINSISAEETTTILRDIHTDALWLSSLVENLLNMTRIQDGRLTVSRKNEVIDDIVEEAVTKASKRSDQHTLRVNRPEDIVLAPVDAQLIIQVLINLLDNAIRHTRAGSIVEVSYFNDAEQVTLEVSDNGGGMTVERLAKVFDPFFTTGGSSDRKRGMGLGLSICKSIVEAHGGSISASNNQAGGATFKIVLPLAYENN